VQQGFEVPMLRGKFSIGRLGNGQFFLPDLQALRYLPLPPLDARTSSVLLPTHTAENVAFEEVLLALLLERPLNLHLQLLQ
jgi:hypothetical protein